MSLPLPLIEEPAAVRPILFFINLTSPLLSQSQDVIDGDLCEQFSSLPHEKQKLVATGLDRTVGEVVKKLEDTRNRLL